ncbi:ectoine/hydroxyectoine ABC transporter substrate-binding protein EhuB [Streptomyces sp. N2-109]|uniref:Ectoine/hydroxyectoine ABC transporter substrate-binding protein EhuB n=1 Tax=Streptomyces gossypii TaxID=2883101 RepID=A0ABT2JV50_9ACTN|nr:ectoine/hydroxyectoine ABC transporter substrate-binding protein EhuB [Streptomyces gossypii]
MPPSPAPPRALLTRRRLLGIGVASVAVGAAGVTTYALTRDEKGVGSPGGAGQGGGALLERLRTAGTVKLGVAGEKPFGYVDGGEPTGEAPEVAKVIFKRLGVSRVEAVTVQFGALLPGLKARSFDVIAASLYITPDRCEEVLFSDPDVQMKDALLVRKGNPHGVRNYEDIAEKGVKLGTGTGYAQIESAEAAGVKGTEVLVDDIAGLRALSVGRIDAFAGTRLMLAEAAKGDSAVEVTEAFWPVVDGKPVHSASGFAFHQSETELRDAFNAELLKLRKTGGLLRIVRPFGFTEEEMTELTAKDLC